MLYSFVQVQRNKKNNDHLNVLYLVAGLSKEDDFGIKVFKIHLDNIGVFMFLFRIQLDIKIKFSIFIILTLQWQWIKLN